MTRKIFDYPELVRRTVGLGDRVQSRYGETVELRGVRVDTQAHYRPLRGNMNSRIGYMELAQLVGGVYDADAIHAVAPKSQRHLFNPMMAYGPRIKDQMPGVIEALRRDPLTRRASVLVARPDDSPAPTQTLDMPCTTSVQFLLRQGELQTLVYMRSWDLMKGLPYDLVMFGGLAQVVACCLGARATDLTVFAGSAHVYVEDHKVSNLPRAVHRPYDVQLPPDWERAAYLARDAVQAAKRAGEAWRPGWVEEYPNNDMEVDDHGFGC